MSELHEALDVAHRLAVEWLDSLPERRVPPRATAGEVASALGDLPDSPRPAAEVIELLGAAAEPGLTAIPSGRWYGMVMGGTLPAALAADWLVSSWDQNSALRAVTPATVALEEVADRWLLDLLGLPPASGVGMATGATMSNFTCLATARDTVLRQAGWHPHLFVTQARAIDLLPGMVEAYESINLIGASGRESWADPERAYFGAETSAFGRQQPGAADALGALADHGFATRIASSARRVAP